MGKDPRELIKQVEQEQQTRGELAKEALRWFLQDSNVEELHPRPDAAADIAEELGIEASQANRAISDTVGDIVDPVQQIRVNGNKYVGVIEYRLYQEEGAYGYIDFDDLKNERKRVVCAKCVEEATHDGQVVHATQGEGSSNSNATWDQLLNKITSHYAQSHTEVPSEIEPGASLNNGTTISGNISWHGGNDGSSSGLHADKVDGYDIQKDGSDGNGIINFKT